MTIIWHEDEQMMCRCLDDMGRVVAKCIDFTDNLEWMFLDVIISFGLVSRAIGYYIYQTWNVFNGVLESPTWFFKTSVDSRGNN